MEAICKFVKLDNQNWSSWKFRMEMLLTREGLFYVVEERKPEPVTAKWSADDKKARATMGLCIEENQYGLVKASQSARDFWECLRRYHEKCTVTSRVSVLKKLCNLNLREGGDLESHLCEIEELFDRLQSAGQEMEDSLKIAMILRSLPESYGGLVTALEGRPDDDLTIQLVKSKLLDEWERRKERSGDSSGEARVLKSEAGSRRAFGGKSEVRCFQCRGKGHYKRDCPDLKGNKRKSEPQRAERATERNAVLFMAGRKTPKCCVIDSGASSHMWNEKGAFTSLKEKCARDVVLADGSVVKSAGCGTVVVTGVDGCGETVTITLTDVLYVPSLNTSLLSVPKLTAKNFEVLFRKNDCDIRDQSGKVVVKGIRSGDLYHLKMVETVGKCEIKQQIKSSQHQWHRKNGRRKLEFAYRAVSVPKKSYQLENLGGAQSEEEQFTPGMSAGNPLCVKEESDGFGTEVSGLVAKMVVEPVSFAEAKKCPEHNARMIESGETARYKARLVARGNEQCCGMYSDGVVAPVIRHRNGGLRLKLDDVKDRNIEEFVDAEWASDPGSRRTRFALSEELLLVGERA